MFSRRDYARVLNLVGLVLVGLDLAQRSLRDAPAAMVAAAWLGWALWAVTVALPERFGRTRTGLFVVMLAAGAFVAGTTDVVGLVPGMVALLALAGTPTIGWRLVGAAIAGAVLLVGVAAVVDPISWSSAVSILAVLLVCALGGFSRRQARSGEAQARALLAERLAVEQERALVAALSERSRIARDLHDVLAHSLGGLVIQLDAVDALLESGRGGEARDRVIAARSLAVSGLDDARQAVTALREPPEDLTTAVADLVETHRAVGGSVVVTGRADQGELTADGRTALRRAVQEVLTNARRHAPGAVTTLALRWDDSGLTFTATTPAGGGPAGRSGGGHGLAGMRERVAEASGTMDVRPCPPFEVALHLPREASG